MPSWKNFSSFKFGYFWRLTKYIHFIYSVYMNTAIVNIKVDPKTKKEAQKVAEELGVSLSSLIKAYLKEIIRTKTVTFSAASEEPSEWLIKTLRESEADRMAGRVGSFESVDDAIGHLDKMIKNEENSKKN